MEFQVKIRSAVVPSSMKDTVEFSIVYLVWSSTGHVDEMKAGPGWRHSTADDHKLPNLHGESAQDHPKKSAFRI